MTKLSEGSSWRSLGRARSMYQFLTDQAAEMVDPWVTLWRDGHGDVWRNDADYIDQHLSRWQAALLR